jgi:MFS transporter, DHA2 family, multidrug resistance protein
VLTSNIVAVAIATPLTGWLSQRPGVKHLMAVAVAGFTIASVLYGIAGTLVQIIGARLLQGLFGAALVPAVTIHPPRRQPAQKTRSGHGGVGNGRNGWARSPGQRSGPG